MCQDMVKDMQQYDIRPDSKFFNTMILDLASTCAPPPPPPPHTENLLTLPRGYHTAAFALFGIMKECKIPPDLYTYNNLLTALLQKKDLLKADVLFHACRCRLLRRPHSPQQLLAEMEKNEVRPNTFTFTILMQICSRAGQHGKAIDYYQMVL